MAPRAKAVKKEFSAPVELTDEWLLEHSPHGLLWSVHTVFNGNDGVKYRECRCYHCRQVAQIKLEDVTTKPVPKEPPQKRRKASKKTYEDFESNGCETHTDNILNEL